MARLAEPSRGARTTTVTGHPTGPSQREMERRSGTAAAREAAGRKYQEVAKRTTRYERAPRGQKGARSRGP